MMKTFLLLFSLILMSANSQAQLKKSPLTVSVDCYISNSLYSCSDIISSFFNQNASVKQVGSNEDPTIAVIIRNIPIQSGTKIIIDYIAKKPHPNFKTENSYSDSLQSSALTIKVTEKLNEAMGVFKLVQEADTDNNGAITIVISDQEKEQTPPPSSNDKTDWYLGVNGTTSLSQPNSDYFSNNSSFSTSINHSGEKFRTQANLGVNYQEVKVRASAGGEYLTAESFSYNGSTVTSYMLDGHWSVAGLASYAHTPTANRDQMIQVGAGIEWNLIPFMTKDSKTLIFRYGIGYVHANLVQPNIEDKETLNYMAHYLLAIWSWHFKRVDVDFTAAVSSPVAKTEFLSFGGGGTFTYYLNKEKTFSLGLTLSGSYQGLSIFEPKTIDYTNILATQMASGYKGLSYFLFINVGYKFGNSSKYTSDQRWKNY